MSSGFLLSLILLALIAFSFYFLLQAEGGTTELPRVLERVGIPWPTRTTPTPTVAQPTTTSLPASFTSGDSRFSQGSCITAADCKVSGCSGEVCGRNEAITTCEFSDDFPNVQGLSCGCVRGKCGWAPK